MKQTPAHVMSSADIDECSETPGLCGKQTVCTNALGTFYCSCPDDFFPSTGIVWTMGVTYCRGEEVQLLNMKQIYNKITFNSH